MSFAALASSGPLVVAVGVAALAGLVSFLSPCVLPLVPGYLSYVTGMAGADLDAALGTDPHGRPVEASGEKARGRILAGGLVFVAGFTVVFTLTGVLVAQAGRVLLVHERIVEIAVGVLVIGLGFRRLLGLFAVVRRHSRWVTRTGGVLLVLVGLALVTGGWTVFVDWLRATVGVGTVGI